MRPIMSTSRVKERHLGADHLLLGSLAFNDPGESCCQSIEDLSKT